MKPSRYNYYVKTEEGALIWNTMTDALVSVNNAEHEALISGRADDLPGSPATDFFNAGILVPSLDDELGSLEKELADMSGGAYQKRGGFYRILTTTACNASCPYCYELGTEIRTMDAGTAHRTADFILGHRCPDRIRMEWFGGEPLLNSDAISLISDDISKAGVCFSSRITTNGSLWTDKLIESAKEKWFLTSAQITVDGIGSEHDRAKGLPPGTFMRTIRSVRKLADAGIKVQLRINHYAGQDHSDLIKWICSEFSGCPGVSAYVAPGYTAGEEHPRQLMREILELSLILSEAGLTWQNARMLPRRSHTGCFACDPDNYTIAPDGRIYNCSHDLSDGQCIGSVNGSVIPAEDRVFLRREFSQKCKSCALLPVCMGGCRAAECGIAQMTQCPPFKTIIPELMEMTYRMNNSDKYGGK